MAIKTHIDVYKESGNERAQERVVVSHESLQRFALIFHIRLSDWGGGRGANICNFKSYPLSFQFHVERA